MKESSKKNKQVSAHSDTIVDSLKGKLRTTTKGFSEVLERRTESLKDQQKEREVFTGNQQFGFGKRTGDSPLFSNGSGEVAIQMPITGGTGSSGQLLSTQEKYIESRETAVLSIEKTITELQVIFRQLAGLVVEQQEMIERIDQDVSTASVRIDGAQNALTLFLSKVSSDRWLAIKIFFVLLIFVFIFVIFFV